MRKTVKIIIFSMVYFITALSMAGVLNDTGITSCSNATENNLPCPQPDYPGQDAEYGRDVTHNDDSDGHAGFSFTKLDENGDDLPASATTWSCVRDNVTGLIWEVKTDDGGLRDKDWIYSWYDTNSSTNGGVVGTSNGGECFDTSNCDTEKYVEQINVQTFCGLTGWRMPFKYELSNLRLLGRQNPSIDINYFPSTISGFYWSSSTYSSGAGIVDFDIGYLSATAKSNELYIRLVY